MLTYRSVRPGFALIATLMSTNPGDSADIDFSVDFDCRPEDTSFSALHECDDAAELRVGEPHLLWIPGAYRLTDNGLGSSGIRICFTEVPFEVRTGFSFGCIAGGFGGRP